MIWTSSAQGKIRKKSEGIFYSTQRFSSWLWPLLWYTVKSGLLCIKTDPWRHEIHLPSSDGSVTSDRSDWHLKWPVKFKIKPVPPPNGISSHHDKMGLLGEMLLSHSQMPQRFLDLSFVFYFIGVPTIHIHSKTFAYRNYKCLNAY